MLVCSTILPCHLTLFACQYIVASFFPVGVLWHTLYVLCTGTGGGGYSGDGSTATSSQLNNPYGLTVDTSGNVYIADQANFRIRKLTLSTGVISTIAGATHCTTIQSLHCRTSVSCPAISYCAISCHVHLASCAYLQASRLICTDTRSMSHVQVQGREAIVEMVVRLRMLCWVIRLE